jgi:hypothetical protein
MGGGFLDVPKRDAGVERGGDERVPEGVWSDRLVDCGAAGDPANDAPSAVRTIRCPSGRRKIGPSRPSPMARSIARPVRGASGICCDLTAGLSVRITPACQTGADHPICDGVSNRYAAELPAPIDGSGRQGTDHLKLAAGAGGFEQSNGGGGPPQAGCCQSGSY